MGAALTQQPANAPGPGPAGNNAAAWQTQHGHAWGSQQAPSSTQGMMVCNQGQRMSNPVPQSSMMPGNQVRRMSDPGSSTPANGQQTSSWASDLTAMLPQALRSLYDEGLAGLEAKLRSAFQGLSPEQEVNVEAKLLAALEREKQAAVDREDYITASHYKDEIDALCHKANKPACGMPSKAASFARAASFITAAHASKGKGKGKDHANLDVSAYIDTVGKGKGKGKGYGSSTGSFDLERARNGKGTVNESFARRERAMANATDPNFRSSFMTDAAQGGSFASRGAPSLTFQNEALGCKPTSSFAMPRPDASFAAGLPCSAARTGQPQLPVGVSFEGTTTQPSPRGRNIHQTSTSSYGDHPHGYTSQQPHAGCTTQRPLAGDNTQRPCTGSFRTFVPMSNSFAGAWGPSGLRPIQEC